MEVGAGNREVADHVGVRSLRLKKPGVELGIREQPVGLAVFRCEPCPAVIAGADLEPVTGKGLPVPVRDEQLAVDEVGVGCVVGCHVREALNRHLVEAFGPDTRHVLRANLGVVAPRLGDLCAIPDVPVPQHHPAVVHRQDLVGELKGDNGLILADLEVVPCGVERVTDGRGRLHRVVAAVLERFESRNALSVGRESGDRIRRVLGRIERCCKRRCIAHAPDLVDRTREKPCVLPVRALLQAHSAAHARIGACELEGRG